LKTFYDFEATDIQNQTVNMKDYEDHVVLVVNTATKCGFAYQFEGLQKLYEDYKDKKFIVLGFPSNQFANQEPGDLESIKTTCAINYGVGFPLFSKTLVKGDDIHPLFDWLTSEKGGFPSRKIKWNFTKFLIDRNGNVVKRFAPTKKPEKLRKSIENIL